MYLLIFMLPCFCMCLNSNETDKLFDFDVDKLFKEVIGHEADHIHETTHAVPDIADEEIFNITKIKPLSYQRLNNSSKKVMTKLKSKDDREGEDMMKKLKEDFGVEDNSPKTVKEIEDKMRELEIQRIFANELNPLPNFEKNEDDPSLITRRFDKLRNEVHLGDGRRQRGDPNLRNLIRNRTLAVMEHFVYATRYKLPYSQILRAKYHNSEQYRIGFCYGLLYQLKRQQILMFTQLTIHQYTTSTLHMHMRLYEKVVRLDVDIKDTIRLIRQIESRRRLKEDRNYYDEYAKEAVEKQPKEKASSGMPNHGFPDQPPNFP
ncbi:hypothetical protein evm_007982 [Chilo suppressalis]|nr:hypothetical protein evm_007982 [Chilo suppressalis]